jgi:hypothetical protein
VTPNGVIDSNIESMTLSCGLASPRALRFASLSDRVKVGTTLIRIVRATDLPNPSGQLD